MKTPADVAAVLQAAPPKARAQLKKLRTLILDTAADIGAKNLEESLKWGEPAYRCLGGSTVRLGWSPKLPDRVAMYFICTTGLVDRFRALYPDDLDFSGNRALLFALDDALPQAPIKHCVAMALTYHAKKAGKRR